MIPSPTHRVLVFALLIMGLAGCVTTPNPFAITVDADVPLTASHSAAKRYAIVFSDQASMDLVDPLNERLRGAMTELGYELAPLKDADLLLRIVAQRDLQKVVTRELTTAETGAPANPDSIRFKNVAAMLGNARYKQLLNDDPNAPGEILMGPQGETIATGNLRERPELGPRPEKRVARKFNRLVLTATETSPAADPEDDGIRWRIEVTSELAPKRPSPGMSVLMETALTRLREASHGGKQSE